MAVVYPKEFPIPLQSPYTWSVDSGLLRTQMDGGFARQRRLYNVMPQAWQLEYVIPMPQLYAWQTWVNTFGFEYFEAQLTSWLSSQAGGKTSPHIIRFTTNLEMELLTPGYTRVRVGAEISPVQVSNYNPPQDDAWVIGGIPDVPSEPDDVLAGAPAAPSGNTIVGGDPFNPSLVG